MNLIPWRNKKRANGDADTALATSARRFRTEMDQLFDRFFRDPWGWPEELFGPPTGWRPALEVLENDREVTIRAEVPGIDPKDIDVTISGNMLTLSGEKKETSEHKGESYFHSERRYGSFRRCIELPTTVDPDRVTAEHANGVLTIHVGKVPSATPKRITVKTNR